MEDTSMFPQVPYISSLTDDYKKTDTVITDRTRS